MDGFRERTGNLCNHVISGLGWFLLSHLYFIVHVVLFGLKYELLCKVKYILNRSTVSSQKVVGYYDNASFKLYCDMLLFFEIECF